MDKNNTADEVRRKLLGLGICGTCKKEKPVKEITLAGGSPILCNNCFNTATSDFMSHKTDEHPTRIISEEKP